MEKIKIYETYWKKNLYSLKASDHLYKYLLNNIYLPIAYNEFAVLDFFKGSVSQWAKCDFSQIYSNSEKSSLSNDQSKPLLYKKSSADKDFMFLGFFLKNNCFVLKNDFYPGIFFSNSSVLKTRVSEIISFFNKSEDSFPSENEDLRESIGTPSKNDYDIDIVTSGTNIKIIIFLENKSNINNVFFTKTVRYQRGTFFNEILCSMEKLWEYLSSELRKNESAKIDFRSADDWNTRNENANNGKSNSQSFFYRGQTSTKFNLLPSVYRTKNLINNEDNIYNESLIKNPESFSNIKNHLSNLKKMQHYGVPTRLLDITSSLGPALYFACEDFKNSSEMATVFVFAPDKSKIKSFNSDNVSVLASFATLPIRLKTNIIKKVHNAEPVKAFNKESDVRRLLHEIQSERQFLPLINPKTFKENYYVQPLLDNRRIINQHGLFIMRSFLNNNLNNDIKVRILIDGSMKKEIIQFLALLGIDQTVIYPELSNVGNYLKDIYK